MRPMKPIAPFAFLRAFALATLCVLLTAGAARAQQHIGEVGVFPNGEEFWQSVSFSQSYSNPIVVVQAQELNGTDVGRYRIRNVTATGFEVSFRDFGGTVHNPQDVGWMVVEEGTWVLPNGEILEAGTATMACCDSPTTVSLSGDFASKGTPRIVATPLTERTASVHLRINSIGNTGFDIRFDDGTGTGASETAHWIAMSNGGDATYGTSRSQSVGASEASIIFSYGDTFTTAPVVFLHSRGIADVSPFTARVLSDPTTSSVEFFLQASNGTGSGNAYTGSGNAVGLFMPSGAINATPGQITVTNTDDSGAGSLREAITNANAVSADDDITFNIAGAGPHTISPLSELPLITDAGVSVDGSTQPGASCGQLTTGTQHTLLIHLDGAGAGLNSEGLKTTAANVTIKGLSVTNFDGHGIQALAGGDSFTGECLHVGVAPDGTTQGANAKDGAHRPGLKLQNVANGTTRNSLISGQDDDAGDYGIRYENVTGGVIEGNIVGLNAAGTAALGNEDGGIYVDGGSSGITVGGTTAATRNISAGNNGAGIFLIDASDIDILGNYIGLDRTGTIDFGNLSSGIAINGSSNVSIGDGTSAGRNVISGTGASGIQVFGAATTGLTVRGNYIGTNAAGTAAIENFGDGIALTGSSVSNVTIGGTGAGDRNVISGNSDGGIRLTQTNSVSILGNYIGTNAAGTGALGNGGQAIRAFSAINTTIGSTTAGNVLVNSDACCANIFVFGSATATIINNRMGLAASGSTPLGTQYSPVYVADTATAQIGDGTAAGANVMTNGAFGGVIIVGGASATVVANSIYGNNGLGIDLTEDGVTANDSGDVDTGVNDLLNFPVINGIGADGTVDITYDFDLDVPVGGLPRRSVPEQHARRYRPWRGRDPSRMGGYRPYRQRGGALHRRPDG